MAVVRSLEGTFYDVPDSELERYKVPDDQAKCLMESPGMKMMNPGQQPSGGAPGGSPQILVQFITQGPPQQVQQGQEGQEAVEPQWYHHHHHWHRWYWVNWYNWHNWYNWY